MSYPAQDRKDPNLRAAHSYRALESQFLKMAEGLKGTGEPYDRAMKQAQMCREEAEYREGLTRENTSSSTTNPQDNSQELSRLMHRGNCRRAHRIEVWKVQEAHDLKMLNLGIDTTMHQRRLERDREALSALEEELQHLETKCRPWSPRTP
ncbi:hypothetical protein [Holophaga foetida]|uniref:hypothetical protein n=1 Tax=Holophaga foetida TaxID=35839 RepID=UPI0002472F16|nr:hypothetical protein [Holophaga foetida]